MGIIAGNNAKLQAGVQSNWSTIVAPTVALDMTQESFKYVPGYISPDSLVGRQTDSRMDIASIKVEGDFGMIVKPDNIGLLLSALLGAESAAADVDGSAVYDHEFTPISAVVASSLPKLTFTVDRIVDVFGYVGCKLDSMSLEARSKDYLRATFSVKGYDEEEDDTESLSISTKRPFQFIDGAITVAEADYAEITSFTLNYNNNLEDDQFVMNGDDRQTEIEPQKRDINMTLEARYSSITDGTRSTYFKTGTEVAIEATFESTEEIEDGYNYTLTVSCPKCYITDASPNVSGPDRIMQSLSVKAAEGTNPAITITLRDGQDSKYIT